ncbi:hypothetical protein NQP46_18385 [Streptomyces albus]|nr:hypothetical protein NQP46_18385 [Streptomyces albus]
MPVTLTSVIIDAADIQKESCFWHRLLGGTLTPTPTHHFVQAPGLPVIVVQSAPGHTAPNWPDGTSQQMHLDFGVDDLATADCTATDAAPPDCGPPTRSPRKPGPVAGSTPARPDTPSACAQPEPVAVHRAACRQRQQGRPPPPQPRPRRPTPSARPSPTSCLTTPPSSRTPSLRSCRSPSTCRARSLNPFQRPARA